MKDYTEHEVFDMTSFIKRLEEEIKANERLIKKMRELMLSTRFPAVANNAYNLIVSLNTLNDHQKNELDKLKDFKIMRGLMNDGI